MNYTSVSLENPSVSEDYKTYIKGVVLQSMSLLGYSEAGFCENPFELEFVYPTLKEPSIDEINNVLNRGRVIFVIERYNIDEI